MTLRTPASLAAARIPRVISISCCSAPFGGLYALINASAPSSISSSARPSLTSPFTTLTPSRPSTFDGFRTTAVTSYSLETSSSKMRLPIMPLAPISATFILCLRYNDARSNRGLSAVHFELFETCSFQQPSLVQCPAPLSVPPNPVSAMRSPFSSSSLEPQTCSPAARHSSSKNTTFPRISTTYSAFCAAPRTAFCAARLPRG